VEGLDDDAARLAAAPGASGDLGEELKVRSAARKSGSARAVSASTTPTRVTPGKSCPFVTIWVPTRTSTSRRANRASTSARSTAPFTASRSSRATRAPGNLSFSEASTCSVP